MPGKSTTFQEDVLANVAHELKTPITAVRGYVELIEQFGELNERQKQYHERAMAGLDKMYEMVVALLDMARLEGESQLHFGDCDIRAIIHEAVEMVHDMATGRDIQIQQDVDSELDFVHGDGRYLSQVVNNLLTNAIKYNRDGGRIWVTAINQADVIRVSVRDNGPGIPAEEQSRVFDQFFRSARHKQTRVDGTGLGLAITKVIIEKHKGRIWLESTPDVGTTFSFVLPRKRHAHEGYDTQIEGGRIMGEGREAELVRNHELPVEPSDSVDDNIQEADGSAESDSSSDIV